MVLLMVLHVCARLTSLAAYLDSSIERHLVPIQYCSDSTAQIIHVSEKVIALLPSL